MVVATGMDHQGAAFEFIELFDARRQHRVVCGTIAVHVERGQVAEVTITVRPVMLAGILRIIVTTRCQSRGGFTVFFCCIAPD